MKARGRWRNFDAIRLTAAIAVVFSHSFLLSAAGYHDDPLVRLLGFPNDVGRLSVGVFLIISGFLVTGSYHHRASALSFLVNRIARIFPALLVATLVTAFVIGPFFAADLAAYLGDPATWAYVQRTIVLHPMGGLDFPARLYEGDYGRSMLGTTWTLTPELVCYFSVLALGAIGAMRAWAVALLLIGGLWAHSQWSLNFLESTAWLAMFFAAGSLLWYLHEQGRRPGHRAIAAAFVAWIALSAAGRPMEALALFGSIVIVQLATSERIVLPDAARFGDLSYGVYLYGWPMQQIVRVAIGPQITWWQMFALTMLAVIPCAWLSWRFVEAPALRLARSYRATVAARSERAEDPGVLGVPLAGDPARPVVGL